MYNGIRFTSEADITRITDSAFEILEQAGVLVEHEGLGALLAAHAPGAIRYENRRLYINRSLARERFLSGAGKQTEERRPSVSACAEIYEGPYLDPVDGQFKPWSEERLLKYFKLGLRLPNVGQVSMLGCPIPGIPQKKAPLFEKLYAFKYGVGGCYSIWDTSLCPKLLQLWELYAKDQGKAVNDVFLGTVYMISPLKLGAIEAEQMLWFRQRGLRVGLGTLASAGLTAPITPAGAIALHISERVFINLVNLVLYGVNDFSLGCALSMADMRTAVFQYGRPEQVLMNSAMSDIADFYGIRFQDHGGLTDAKLPSFEAGLQKTATALSSVMNGRNGYFAAGLLSIDEVFSPVQMVLDNEAAGYLQRICRGFGCTDDDIGVQAVLDCTNEGLLFMMHEHTAEHMREAAWNPTVFSREMLGKYKENGGIDAERAREIALSIMHGPELERRISEDCEADILQIIENV